MDQFDSERKDGQGGIPLTILTGFLGAGKTTLLNRIRIVETSYCEVPYEILMAVGRFDPARQLRASNGHDHDDEGK